MSQILSILADDNSQISYRPKLNAITESVTATILLQQILFRFKNKGWKYFYKFKQPCDHELYKEGDSWCEELGFSKSEFDTALKKIAIKRTRHNKDNLPDALVYYWTTPDRVTYYSINVPLLEKKVTEIYVNQESGFTKSQNHDLSGSVKPDSVFTESNIDDFDITETTSETSENTIIVKDAVELPEFIHAFNDFCTQENKKYRDRTLHWIVDKANFYESSIDDVIHSLEICCEKEKEGEIHYLFGILENKALDKANGINGVGIPVPIQIIKSTRKRLSVHMDYIKYYDFNWEDNKLYYSLKTSLPEEREAVHNIMKIVTGDIKNEFGVEFIPEFKL